MASPTAGWQKVGKSFYRKYRVYDAIFDQELELENHFVAGATCGGAIALHRNHEKLQTFRQQQSPRATIDIYSCAGHLIRRINWDNGPIKGLGWAENETLVVVTGDGTVRRYGSLQEDFVQFTLGIDAENHGVRACRFWSHGLVALLSNNQLIAVTQYNEPRPKPLATPPSGAIHSWTAIAPSDSLSRSVEVFLALENTIYIVDANEAEDRVLPNGPFKHVVASPNGMYLALFTEDGKVWVITSDFQQKIIECDSKSRIIPRDVQWCGNDSVLLAWEDEVQLVSPDANFARFFYDDYVHLVPDIDGVRLITNEVCDFLQKVPDLTEEVFRLDSTSPASILFDAAQQLERGSPKADESIQLIRQNLPVAVATCVKVAGQQYDINWQKHLLKAASFGTAMLDLYSNDDFVEMCQTIRILNAVRDHTIGLPLTIEQYMRLKSDGLIQRLISRREYSLAVQLLEFLKRSTSNVFVQWAEHLVRTSQAEEGAILQIVTKRLQSKRGIPFEVVARAAYKEGRNYLATELLHQETRAGKQVPLLLSMSEDDLALDKAIASGDTDLVYFVLLQMRQKLQIGSFFQGLTRQPLAAALVETSARTEDEALLKDLYYRDDRRMDLANFLFMEGLRQNVPQTKVDKMKLATNSLKEDSKDSRVASSFQMMQEAQRLIRLQTSLDQELLEPSRARTQFVGLSVNQTIYQLILQSQLKRAQKISQDFHLSSRVYDWTRLRALVASRNWQELEDHGQKTKKSAIGWESYFNEIILAGNIKLAGTVYVSKCLSLTARERSEMYIKCGMPRNAGEELVKTKDAEALEALKDRLDPGGRAEIESMIASLRKKR